MGRRVSKTINGTTTAYQYDGQDIVAEIGGGSAVSATYIRSLNIDELFARITSNGVEYYHTDALGSVLALTDASGNTTTTYTYDPFGNTTQSGVSSNPFQYTGRENDGTGLYYYRARYYSPALQRFISEDPAGFIAGINVYAYVKNNPLNAIDPLGLECTQSPWRQATTYSDPNNKGILISSYSIERWHRVDEWNNLPLVAGGQVMEFTCACRWEKTGYNKVSTYMKDVLFEADVSCCGKQKGKIYREFSETYTVTENQLSIFSPEFTVTVGVYRGDGTCTCKDP